MKKYFGIFFLLTTLILFTGCGNTTNNTNNTASKATDTVNDCKKGCTMLTNETINTENCYKLCETSQKLESNDISDCNDIEKTSGNFITKDVCIQDKAIQSKNPEFCKNIAEPTMRDTCYMGLAGEIKDKTVCESIKNDTIKSVCLSEKE